MYTHTHTHQKTYIQNLLLAKVDEYKFQYHIKIILLTVTKVGEEVGRKLWANIENYHVRGNNNNNNILLSYKMYTHGIFRFNLFFLRLFMRFSLSMFRTAWWWGISPRVLFSWTAHANFFLHLCWKDLHVHVRYHFCLFVYLFNLF